MNKNTILFILQKIIWCKIDIKKFDVQKKIFDHNFSKIGVILFLLIEYI